MSDGAAIPPQVRDGAWAKRQFGRFEGAVAIAGLAVAWQIASLFFPNFLFPTVPAIAERFLEIFSSLDTVLDALATAGRILAGLAGAFILGGALAAAMARSTAIDRYAYPLLSFNQGIPALSWVVIAIIWFKGIEFRIFFIMVMTTLPGFTFQLLDAYRSMSNDLYEMTLSFRPTRYDLLRFLIWPTVLPGILTAWKVNLGNASRVVVVAELVGATGGVGYQLLLQQQVFDMAGAIAWTIVLVIFVLIIQSLITLIETRCAEISGGVGAGAVTDEVPEIAFERVTKSFPRTDGAGGTFDAVRELSFTVRRGELVAILGRTGCGKSTTFNLISGLLRPTSGKVSVKGHDPFAQFRWFRGKIGIVFQNDRLMPWRTAFENVELGLELNKVEKVRRTDIVTSWLTRLGLKDHGSDFPHALSGGMRQRVSIARAFATRPEILLCDEPFSALDEHTGNVLREEFRGLIAETGATAIFITHSIEEALKLGGRLMVFERPARIAYETRLTAAMTESDCEEVRHNIRRALAA